MDSAFLPREKVAAFRWADLPPELLAIIFGRLQNGVDLVRFRWVCRSWRFCAPLPNKLSPFFPLALPYPVFLRDLTINVSIVYLLRLRCDPSKAWMVSLQESVAGKLVLRHALTYAEIAGVGPPLENPLDLSPDDWILTQVARSHSHNIICKKCNAIERRTKKVAFVRNSGSGESGSSQSAGMQWRIQDCTGGDGISAAPPPPPPLIVAPPAASGGGRPCSPPPGSISASGMCQMENYGYRFGFFEIGLSGEAREIDFKFGVHRNPSIIDFVKFKGQVYAINDNGILHLVDYEQSRLLPINYHEIQPSTFLMWLVVSDGDLYVVSSIDLSEFTIYRLLITRDDEISGKIKRGKWKKVRDLGERVFFLTANGSFSVSGRDLPQPWKGNCIVHVNSGLCCINPKYYDKVNKIHVFFVGGQRPRLRLMSSLQGYTDLFDPPSSWIHNQ